MMQQLFINWNPDVIALDLGFISIRWYSLCWCIGLVAVYLLMHHLYRQQKISEEQFEPMFIYCFLGILIGARLGHCLFYEPSYFTHHITEMLLPIRETTNPERWTKWLMWLPTGNAETHWAATGYEGLASHGGTLGLMIALFRFFHSSEALSTLDSAGLPLPRHPGQLYEAICYACFFFIGWYFYKKYPKRVGTGFFFGLCLFLIFTSRILIEYTKENQVDFENGMLFNMGQLLSVPFVLLGIFCMWRAKKTTAN